MRLKIKFRGYEKPFVTLPVQYNEIIQGFIYRHIDRWLGKEIHDKGFKDPESKRVFKFFTFSRLIPDEKISIKDEKIILSRNLTLIVSSPFNDFIQSFATNLLKAESIKLKDENLILLSVEVEGVPRYREKVYVKTLSPITVYSTLMTKDGRKKTYYYSPFEKEFEEQLIKNLQRKLRTWNGKTASGGSIKPYRVSSKDERIVIYKGTVIKGWDGIFELKLPEELFSMAFETGLGAKNSSGFGCIEVWEGERDRK
jgi:CRISPR-associated endoribonuclease Cas6